MKKVILALGLLCIAGTTLAAGRPCAEVKNEIAAKLDAKGARHYSLKVVEKGSEPDAKVVGHCEAGSKEIVYRRH